MAKFKVTKVYSKTLESDVFGRWLRIIHSGNVKAKTFSEFSQMHEIATIRKDDFANEGIDKKGKFYFNGKFIVTYQFPSANLKIVFDSEEQAVRAVKNSFNKFIKDVTK